MSQHRSPSRDHVLEDNFIRELSRRTPSRYELWTEFAASVEPVRAAELGVYRGGFAARMLRACPSIQTYYMIDPWKHLDDWNKPSNQDDELFSRIFAQAQADTEFAGDRRVFLRGRTTEIIDRIPDASLDFVYIDGDHTLRGITIDLIQAYSKVRPGGWIAGDDFTTSVWQHNMRYEPTFVFPFAVHFAEAMRVRILALPHSQFLIRKPEGATQFELVDLTGEYGDTSLRDQIYPDLRRRVRDTFSISYMRRQARRLAKSLIMGR